MIEVCIEMNVSFQFILILIFILLLSSIKSLDVKTGTIYKLQCQVTAKVYIGRTTAPIEKAMKKNKDNFKHYTRVTHKKETSLFELMANNNYNVTILDVIYKLANDTDFSLRLRKLQRFYIEKSGNAVNKYKPSRTKKEYYVDNIDHKLQYRKEHYEDNRESELQQKKQYYQRIRAQLLEKVTCEVCGVQLSRAALSKHKKSLRHLTALAKLYEGTIPYSPSP